MGSLKARLERFFYAEEIPFGMAAARITLPLVLLGVTLARWPVTRELYSADGAPAQLGVGYGYPDFLPEFSGTVAVALHTLLVFTLVTSCLGWHTRLSLAFATVLYTYFNLMDCVSTMTKYSVIATHGLLLLTLSHCGAVWSVDAWRQGIRRRAAWPGEASIPWPRFAVWPRRLTQILIGIIYLGAAITKMRTPTFFSGDQLLMWMITHLNLDHPLGDYFALYPASLVVMAYLTILWEVAFLFLMWRGIGRLTVLGIGIVFHLMTWLTLGLLTFPLVCYALYFAFLEERDVRRIAALVRKVRRRFHWGGSRLAWLTDWLAKLPTPGAGRLPAGAAFGCVALTAIMAGVEIEYRMDLYGERRPEGRHTLKPLDPETVARLLGPDEPVRPVDKIFAFDVGTATLGGIVANRRGEFRQGESLIAQCTLTPPHEDLWLNCDIHDEDESVVRHQTVLATREMFRSNFNYRLDNSFAPGRYALVLKSNGRELARRTIALLPRHSAPVAN